MYIYIYAHICMYLVGETILKSPCKEHSMSRGIVSGIARVLEVDNNS